MKRFISTVLLMSFLLIVSCGEKLPSVDSSSDDTSTGETTSGSETETTDNLGKYDFGGE